MRAGWADRAAESESGQQKGGSISAGSWELVKECRSPTLKGVK